VVGLTVAASTENILALGTLYSVQSHMNGSVFRNRLTKLVFVARFYFTHVDREFVFAFGTRLDVGVALHIRRKQEIIYLTFLVGRQAL
jgi:hypothetical protein